MPGDLLIEDFKWVKGLNKGNISNVLPVNEQPWTGSSGFNLDIDTDLRKR